MNVIETKIPGVKIIEPDCFGDHRGWFMETYSTAKYEAIGINNVFVQDNCSMSAKKGTLRGLHFQNNPMAQAKPFASTMPLFAARLARALVSCLRSCRRLTRLNRTKASLNGSFVVTLTRRRCSHTLSMLRSSPFVCLKIARLQRARGRSSHPQ